MAAALWAMVSATTIGALGRQLVEDEDAVLDVGAGARDLADRELLGEDLRVAELRQGATQPQDLRLAPGLADVVEDQRARREEVDRAARRRGEPELMEGALGLRVARRQLLEREVLDEGQGVERVDLLGHGAIRSDAMTTR